MSKKGPGVVIRRLSSGPETRTRRCQIRRMSWNSFFTFGLTVTREFRGSPKDRVVIPGLTKRERDNRRRSDRRNKGGNRER